MMPQRTLLQVSSLRPSLPTLILMSYIPNYITHSKAYTSKHIFTIKIISVRVYNNIKQVQVMMEQPSMIVKISFKHINRIERLQSKSLQQLVQKIYQHWELPTKTYYRLYYHVQSATISINNQQTYQQFLTLTPKRPKLFLSTTEDPTLHFSGKAAEVKAYQQDNKWFQRQASKLKEQMKLALQAAKGKMIEKVQEQLKQLAQYRSSQVHYGFECDGCHANDFKGVRYQCAICNYNLCQCCEEGNKHNPKHPLIKIKDSSIRITHKQNILPAESIQQKKQAKEIPELATRLMQIFSLPKEQARKLVSTHPRKNLNQLIDIYLSEQ